VAQIDIRNLTFSYEGSYDDVFSGVSFRIDTDWRLGLIGRNGRGKTTFLNLLLGKYEYKGIIDSPVGFEYFPFEIKDESANTIDILNGFLSNEIQSGNAKTDFSDSFLSNGIQNKNAKSDGFSDDEIQNNDMKNDGFSDGGIQNNGAKLGGFSDGGIYDNSIKPDDFSSDILLCGGELRGGAADFQREVELWQIVRELSLLEVKEEVLYRRFDTLSNGERTKVLLAALFLKPDKFLLIDEPTNHLDAAARALVGGYLRSKKGFILASHDRTLLDACVDRILSINKADIEVRRGNFSSWFEDKTMRDEYEAAENERLSRDIKKLSEAAKRTASWSDKVEKSKYEKLSSGLKPDRGYVGHKAAKLMKTSKSIERRQNDAIEDKSKLLKNIETADSLSIKPIEYRSERLVEFRSVGIYYNQNTAKKSRGFRDEDNINDIKTACGSFESASEKIANFSNEDNIDNIKAEYGNPKNMSEKSPNFGNAEDGNHIKTVCENLNFTIKRGDRAALVGKNGSGKSSVLKLVCGENIPHVGVVDVGSNLKISYIPQDASFLRGGLREFALENSIDESFFKTMLKKLDLSREQFDKDMSEFSEGQKKKVLLAKSLCERANLYIWDEPLNYIDIFSCVQIEDLILQGRPTMLFVEHDAAFTDKIATKIIEI
jgi:lincosamide and streptogramin A transport system ATP-binding/permease protein